MSCSDTTLHLHLLQQGGGQNRNEASQLNPNVVFSGDVSGTCWDAVGECLPSKTVGFCPKLTSSVIFHEQSNNPDCSGPSIRDM